MRTFFKTLNSHLATCTFWFGLKAKNKKNKKNVCIVMKCHPKNLHVLTPKLFWMQQFQLIHIRHFTLYKFLSKDCINLWGQCVNKKQVLLVHTVFSLCFVRWTILRGNINMSTQMTLSSATFFGTPSLKSVKENKGNMRWGTTDERLLHYHSYVHSHRKKPHRRGKNNRKQQL